MACTNCGSGTPNGCGNNGNCGSGSCNKLNTYDWISTKDIHDPQEYNYVEVSFKNGARKDFYIKEMSSDFNTGDMVVVDADSGSDVGQISLSGELVRLQMKKKRVAEKSIKRSILRVANDRDLEKLEEARSLEKQVLVRSRVIARTLGLDMKIGDIEFQGDQRKATFYYTADGRVDFRELVRQYAREFKIKIEMRQIGSRQESARIGGIGSCGRELCCSTWLTDFKTVTTSAARYQNISINQTKLSGQCGRLKCCLNYELDSYMDALKHFPKKADKLKSQKGLAELVKTDIFKGLLYYSYVDPKLRGALMALDIDRVKHIQEMNQKNKFPEELIDLDSIVEAELEKEIDFADVTGQIELPSVKRKKRRNKRKKPRKPGQQQGSSDKTPAKHKANTPTQDKKNHSDRNKDTKNTSGKNARRNKRRPNKNQNKPTPSKGNAKGNNNTSKKE